MLKFPSLIELLFAAFIFVGIPCLIAGCLIGGCKYQIKVEKTQ